MKLNKVIAFPVLALAAGLSLAACGGGGATAAGPTATNTLPYNTQVCPLSSQAFNAAAVGIKCGNLGDAAYLASLIHGIVSHPQYQSGSTKIDPSQFGAMFSVNGAGYADVVQLFGDQAHEVTVALQQWNDN